MKKIILLVFSVAIIIAIAMPAEASSKKVMWGKSELKPGQIGKITILKETTLFSIDNNIRKGEITPSVPVHFNPVKQLHPGEVYRVYTTKSFEGYVPLYGIGGGFYVVQSTGMNPNILKYETPSKAKLLLVNKK